ncbi:MAG: ATP-dependent zinc metalloprotease FtsH [Candidatus Cloacimonadales bacterium]
MSKQPKMPNRKPDPNKKPNKPPKMNRTQSITFWVVAILMVAVLFQFSKLGEADIKKITFTQFEKLAENGEIAEVRLDGRDIIATGRGEDKFTTYLPFVPDSPYIQKLVGNGININSLKPSLLKGFLFNILPFVILIGFWWFMMRGMRGGAGQAFSFGKSKARLFAGGKTKVTFKDVAGVDEAKEELEEIIEYLKAPKKFQRLGGRIPRGVMLLGRPGTGKTLLAKAVAGEAKVPFFSISGSDFVEMFVGVGASRVRDMFSEAKKQSPCIAFIDEIDAVGRHRGAGLGGGNDEREQTLNQLLVEMDGFDENDSVIIIAATNRPDVLDPALLRPGRFDRQVVVDLPDIKGREAILKVHSKKTRIAKTVNFSLIARGTPGFSGADLANLVNEAALMAARKDKKQIEMNDFEEAKDKVTLGKARKSRIITDEEKRNTAYHEIGHVICSIFQEKAEPIHKVTIIPRGFTGGATHFLQTTKSNYSKSYLVQSLVGLLGGRCAEEVAFDEQTTGASNDIERATDIALKMVCNWGMSKKIGPIVVAQKESQVFLGKDISQHKTVSEKTANLIDDEVHTIVNTAYTTAIEIIQSKRELLDALSEALLEKETLNSRDIYELTLEHTTPSEREFVQKKYDHVKEMSMDINPENIVDTDNLVDDEKIMDDTAENEAEQSEATENESADNEATEDEQSTPSSDQKTEKEK